MGEDENLDLASDMKKEDILLEKIKGLEDKAKVEKQNANVSVKYYEDASLQLGKNILRVSIAEITEKFLDEQAQEQSKTTFDVYMRFAGEDVQIGSIDETGKLQLNKDTIQRIDPENKLGLMEIGDQEKPDLSVLKDMEGKTREELEKDKEERDKEKIKDGDEKDDRDDKDNGDKDGEEEELDEEGKDEDELTKEIAKRKNIPERNVYRIRPDSQFFKNYPQVDKSTYFYRDIDGKMKAEFIDAKGQVQPSPFFQDSSTHLKDPVVSVGTQGNDISEKRPYQQMRTQGLNRQYGVRDVRMSIYFENGYIDMEETRLGDDGKWVGYGIEKTGRDYNSKQVNDISDTKRKQDNSEYVSEGYDLMGETGFKEDGLTIDELDPKKTIERLMDEGYNKNESVRIVNYMIGQDALTEDEAKAKVNAEIEEELDKQEAQYQRDNDDDGQKVPWENATSRRGY